MNSMGIRLEKINLEKDEKVLNIYRKYFGPDYKPGSFYTTVIGNHLSWADILLLLKNEAPSFVSKSTIKSMPIIAGINNAIQGMYVDRASKDARTETMNLINTRQKDVEAGKILVPVTLYPEGTTSSGRYLIVFKKGAFHTLSSIKPYIISMATDGKHWPLGSGGMDLLLHMIVTALFVDTELTSYELPVVTPTDFLFEKHTELGKDKPDIYLNALRQIMSEISGLKTINSVYEDKLAYMSEIMGRKVKGT